MEEKLKIINAYFEIVYLKAFCQHYGQSYEFTRQVLNGKKPATEKFVNTLVPLMVDYNEKQNLILKKLQ